MPELGPQTLRDGRTASSSARRISIPKSRAAAVEPCHRSRGRRRQAGRQDVRRRIPRGECRRGRRRTSSGLFAYHRSTDADLSVTARTPDGTGTGWASAGARDWGASMPAALGRIAAQKAVGQPESAGDRAGPLHGRARAAGRGRSHAAARRRVQRAHQRRRTRHVQKAGRRHEVGEKIADERVTIYSDPADPELLGAAVRRRGLPLGAWCGSRTASSGTSPTSRSGRRSRARQPTAVRRGGGGGRRRLSSGGTKTTEELIAGCERGILVTHFFYIRSLDPRTVLLTGLTRDGTFLIEKGKITRALKNFRWNESPLFMLNKIEEIGRAEPTAAGRMMPALRVRDFNFSSLSDAV